eukprot:TRINITY_DN7463_c0_g2_i2.p1 TRINITY_DN7463_c0_g2~~TRINITY_DN7463_c0_g2_i2.p1  ORF type:complete len:419 (-),score=52.21 TRINITY_DN7463_c0_g2_i2:121-1377(-)
MFPEHPNLLPAFFTIEEAKIYTATQKPVGEAADWAWVAKPRFGREGLGIRYSFEDSTLADFDKRARADIAQLEAQEVYNPSLLWQLENASRALCAGVSSPSSQPSEQHLLEDRKRGAQGDTTMRAELPFPPLGGPVFQLYEDTATFSGRRPVIGAWTVFGSAAGICVREDIQQTTDNDSSFTPHLVDLQMSAPLQVTQSLSFAMHTRPAMSHDGTYKVCGQLRGHPTYYCADNGMYLIKNDEGYWMFTVLPEGGDDGLVGSAVAASKGADPCGIRNWSYLTTFDNQFSDPGYPEGSHIAVTRRSSDTSTSAATRGNKQLSVSTGQASIRKRLYGEVGGPVAEPEHVYDTSGGSMSYMGGRPFIVDNHSHYRPSAAEKETWRKYGKTAQGRPTSGARTSTGSHGRAMGSTGRSGGYGGS